MYDKAFITGADSNTEWMLEWFLSNYRKHNDTKILFMDFGVSDNVRNLLTKFDGVIFPQELKKSIKNWYRKPEALLKAPAKKKCWIDTDCEVLGDISSVFDYIEPTRLAMVEDIPWSRQRKETWHNSGVVAVEGTPDILKKWDMACKDKPINRPLYGDQDILHEMMKDPLTRRVHITDLPNKFNYLRLQVKNNGIPKDKPLIIHWTGQRGKEEIKRQMGQ